MYWPESWGCENDLWLRAAVPGTALHKCVYFEPECSVSSEGGLSVWENYSSSQSMLLFGNPDQAVQKLVIGKS